MEKQINAWLKKYGPQCNDADFGYDEDQMYDDLCYDLEVKGDDYRTREQVVKLIREYIRTH